MTKKIARAASRWLCTRIRRVTNLRGGMYCPVCENKARRFYPFGNPPRPFAQCPHCGSLERHRLDWLFFKERTDLFSVEQVSLLHIAPEKFLAKRFGRAPNLDYLSGDIAEGRAMIKIDVTEIQYPDNSFSAIYCSHVLEHIEDDHKAITELFRVLQPGGWAVIQVPINAEKTFEDPSVNTPEGRLKIFGQVDHVRRCGLDYIGRLRAGGFSAEMIQATDLASAEYLERIGVQTGRVIFDCRKPVAQQGVAGDI